MKYLRIKNKGLIEAKALTLIGASSKVGDSSKIGMFGSGNKYAMAYLMRNDMALKIFAGNDEIKVSTVRENFRGDDFEIVCIDDEKTSITTSMGKDWVLWQAVREIYCNAIDEGGSGFDVVSDIRPQDGETHFYIGMNEMLEDFMKNFSKYFSMRKNPVVSNEYGKVFTKRDGDLTLYRKGIRCWDGHKKSKYDYDFKTIQINESRVISYHWEIQEHIWNIVSSCDDKNVIMNFLAASQRKEFVESITSSMSTLRSHIVSGTFKEVISGLKLAPMESGALCTSIEKETFMFIPQHMYDTIEVWMKEENKAIMFSSKVGDKFFSKTKMSSLQEATLSRALEFFKEADYSIDYPIDVVSFAKKEVLGYAYGEKIYISNITVDKGVQEVCNTIIEEHIHLKYDVRDETRAFQTAIIDEMLSVMKKASAFIM
jgi:hypothetical protein